MHPPKANAGRTPKPDTLGSAVRASLAERPPALVAEARARTIIGSTVRTAHRLTRKPRGYYFLYHASWKKSLGRDRFLAYKITSICPVPLVLELTATLTDEALNMFEHLVGKLFK